MSSDIFTKTKYLLQNNTKIVIVILVILNIISLSFGALHSRANSQYEHYLSLELYNDVSFMSSDMAISNFLLSKITREKKATYNSLLELERNFNSIYLSGRRIIALAKSLNYLDNSSNIGVAPYPVSMGSDFSHTFLRPLIDNFEEGQEIIEIRREELEYFELMLQLNTAWIDAMEKNIKGMEKLSDRKYYITEDGEVSIKERTTELTPTSSEYREYKDTYLGEMIRSEDWVLMLRDMKENSYEFQPKFDRLRIIFR